MPPTPRPGEPSQRTDRVETWRGSRRSLLRSLAVAPVVLVRSRSAGAAPAGPGLEVDSVAALPGVRLPAGPLVLAIARVTLPPGIASGATTVAGARLIAAERGAVTLRLAGPDLPAFGPGPVGRVVVGPEAEFRLREGQALALPARAVEELANEGTAPAVALDAAIFPASARRPRSFIAADGTDVRLLASVRLDQAPAEPVDFALRRVSLPPGAAMPPQFGEGIALLWVASGRLQVEVAAGAASLAIVAGPVGPTGSPRTARAGTVAYLPAGSSAATPLGSTLLAGATANAASNLLLATLHPSAGRSQAALPNDAPGSRRGDVPHRRYGEFDEPGG